MDLWIVCGLIGIVAGVLAGMFGIGGGVVIVPALIFLCGFALPSASGTSLAALLLPVSIFAVVQYHKAGYMNIRAAMWIALGLLSGVYFGAEFALGLPADLLKQLYGIFLLYVSYMFIQPLDYFRKDKKKVEKPYRDNLPIYYLLFIGIIAGLLAGMFGIGGGLVITPFLMGVAGFDPKKAIGTSLAALLLPVGLPGVILYYQSGNLNFAYAAPVAAGLVIGSIIGAKITISMSSKLIKKTYGVFVLIMALYFILQKYIY